MSACKDCVYFYVFRPMSGVKMKMRSMGMTSLNYICVETKNNTFEYTHIDNPVCKNFLKRTPK